MGQRFDRCGGRREEIPISTLDRQMERVTAMIEACTQDLNDGTLNTTRHTDQNKHLIG